MVADVTPGVHEVTKQGRRKNEVSPSTCLWMVPDVTPGVHEVTKQGRRKNEVSPGVFYGSPTGNPSRRPFQLVRLLHEIQNDLALQTAPKPRYMVLSCPKE